MGSYSNVPVSQTYFAQEHPLASSQLLQHTTEIPYEMVPKYPNFESSKSIKISNMGLSVLAEQREHLFFLG